MNKPNKMDSNIRNAWMAAAISSIITLTLVIVSISTGKSFGEIDPFNVIDVIILSTLAFGIYKRSRICAIIIVLYSLLNEGYVLTHGITVSPLRIIFLYLYIMGLWSIFKYHRIK